jgi:excisionase family DNA binding protein
MQPPPDLISLQAAADLLGVHNRTVRRWITIGRIRGWRLGPRLLRVELSEVLGQVQPDGVEQSA